MLSNKSARAHTHTQTSDGSLMDRITNDLDCRDQSKPAYLAVLTFLLGVFRTIIMVTIIMRNTARDTGKEQTRSVWFRNSPIPAHPLVVSSHVVSLINDGCYQPVV